MNLLDAVLDLIFPPRCCVCKALSERPLCLACEGSAQAITNSCAICGRPKDPSFVMETCTDCLRQKPEFDLARSMAVYEGALKEAIHKFKFSGKKKLAPVLSDILVSYLGSNPFRIDMNDIDLVTAVPLTKKREKGRGYDQSGLLAECIAAKIGVPFSGKVIRRIRETRPQFELKRSERFDNVAGAFSVPLENDLLGKTILLVDDILTTGATVSEASRVLKLSGARSVYVLTLLRAVD